MLYTEMIIVKKSQKNAVLLKYLQLKQQIDLLEGFWVGLSTNKSWRNKNVLKHLSINDCNKANLGTKVTVENEANASAIAEKSYHWRD